MKTLAPHDIEIVAAEIEGAVEAVGDDCHGAVCLGVLRSEQFAKYAAAAILNPQLFGVLSLRGLCLCRCRECQQEQQGNKNLLHHLFVS